jgi:hypothetical protein
MKKSPVPKPRPRSPLAPKKSPVPMSRDEGMASLALKRYMAGATSREGEDMKTFGKPDKKAKGGKLIPPSGERILRNQNQFAREEMERRAYKENPDDFIGLPKRVRTRFTNDATKAQSDKLLDRYGTDAARSRGFMAYEPAKTAKGLGKKPVQKKAKGGKASNMAKGGKK